MNKCVVFLVLLYAQIMVAPSVWHAHRAGLWYPGNSSELLSLLVKLDHVAQNLYATSQKSTVQGLIAPHAALQYSGAVAAAVYRLVPQTIKRVVIMAPSHFLPLEGCALPLFTTYRTVLGETVHWIHLLYKILHNCQPVHLIMTLSFLNMP
jgi:AmmeMemoRadiSam system protein B